MEPQVVISAMIGGVVFLVLVVFVWRMQNKSWKSRTQAAGTEGQHAVTTAPLITGHTDAPLVLSYTADEIENPTDTNIEEALAMLEANLDDTVMLDDADGSESYLQVYRERDDEYCVEYHDGRNNRHYRADPNLTLEGTRALFFAFNLRDWDGVIHSVNGRDTTNAY